jgi:hypothetical protein
LTQLVLTAYDITAYLSEALPALKAAVYRSNLSPARDVLVAYNESLLNEWDLNDLLPDSDFRWIFTEECAQIDMLDPDGDLVGLTYPLIMLYHHPDVLRLPVPGGELDDALPFPNDFERGLPGLPGSDGLVEPGFTEGLRTMWEIVGYLSVERTRQLHRLCVETAHNTPLQTAWARAVAHLANALDGVVQRGYGLIVERE